MKCPNCNETLVMADRQGVEIDYCPKCRGVWLDRGELDKIIERSADYSPNNNTSTGHVNTDRHHDHDDDYYKKQYPQGGGYYNDPHHKHKKKKGFLGDFFDFD
jgi:Zn-finger nucleic acid-binding protein